jgi:hypothetical protein
MYVITYFLRSQLGTSWVSLESVSTPSLGRACTIADALKVAGYAVRIWRNRRLI